MALLQLHHGRVSACCSPQLSQAAPQSLAMSWGGIHIRIIIIIIIITVTPHSLPLSLLRRCRGQLQTIIEFPVSC